MTKDYKRFKEEIFVRKVYGEKPTGVVVDIGAHRGVYTEYARDTAKIIYAIEPSKDNFKKLLRFNKKYTNVKCFNLAIGAVNEMRELYSGDSDGSYSLIKAGGAQTLCQTVEVKTLKTFLNENNIVKIDTLKIDCEGAEHEIITNSFKELGIPITRIVGENHFGDNDIYPILKECGYNITMTGSNTFIANYEKANN